MEFYEMVSIKDERVSDCSDSKDEATGEAFRVNVKIENYSPFEHDCTNTEYKSIKPEPDVDIPFEVVIDNVSDTYKRRLPYRNSKVYRWCGVPQCKNTSIKTRNKLFVFVPQNKTIRNKWLKLARRDSKGILPSTHLYFCEDHFDLPNDMDNYMEYHLMGSVSQIRMKPGCMPTKFQCQSDRRKRTSNAAERPYILKKQRKTLIEECQKDLEERTTKQAELEGMPCGRVNSNKKERQQRYREQNREKLKQREAERRKRIQYSQSVADPSTTSNTNIIELNNKEIVTAQSSPVSEKIQASSIHRSDQSNEPNALQKKRERQQRYRQRNRDKLKQREVERRRRLQNADVITELPTSRNIELTDIINDPIKDGISTK